MQSLDAQCLLCERYISVKCIFSQHSELQPCPRSRTLVRALNVEKNSAEENSFVIRSDAGPLQTAIIVHNALYRFRFRTICKGM